MHKLLPDSSIGHAISTWRAFTVAWYRALSFVAKLLQQCLRSNELGRRWLNACKSTHVANLTSSPDQSIHQEKSKAPELGFCYVRFNKVTRTSRCLISYRQIAGGLADSLGIIKQNNEDLSHF